MPATLLIIVGAYLIGSISFAVVVSRAFGLPDPHEYGSKNPGATNVLRTGNKLRPLLTMLGDGAEGVRRRVRRASSWRRSPVRPTGRSPAAALAVFVGHLYPVFHRFAGGKGVATAAGIVFALHWPLGLVLTVIWLTMAFGFKISSLAALTTAVLLPLGMFYAMGPAAYAWASVAIALLLFWRHRVNIRQLLSRTRAPDRSVTLARPATAAASAAAPRTHGRSTRHRRCRSAPTSAIIAPLSVQNFGSGKNTRPPRRSTASTQARAQFAIRADAARDDQLSTARSRRVPAAISRPARRRRPPGTRARCRPCWRRQAAGSPPSPAARASVSARPS